MENTTSRPRRMLRLAAPLVAAAAVGAGVAVAVDSTTGSSGSSSSAPPAAISQSTTSNASAQLSAREIYERSVQGVVEIQVTATSDGSFPFGGGETQAEGSGFVVDKQGHVVTNYHVVEGASSVTVKFHDGTTAKATVVGSDPSTDVAVLKVDVSSSKLTPLSFADSSKVEPGDGVVAIGSPFGLEDSITAGIVSGVGRTIDAPDGSAISGAIQTDAAINHGNSGGPLLDLSGNVIGITSQIESGQTGTDGNVGVGFAVPSNTVRSVVSQLIAKGSVQHAFLGIQPETVTTPVFGVRIVSVESGTPAAKAGLKAGDVIATIDGKSVTTADALRAAIAAHKPGDTVKLGVVSGSTRKVVTVTLTSRPTS